MDVEAMEQQPLVEQDNTDTSVRSWRVGIVGIISVLAVSSVALIGLHEPSGRPVTKDGFFIGLASDDHDFQHMSDECVKDLLALEKESKKKGKKHQSRDHDLECEDETMTCKLSAGETKTAKCFPKKTCKPTNIRKELLKGGWPTDLKLVCGDEEVPAEEDDAEEDEGDEKKDEDGDEKKDEDGDEKKDEDGDEKKDEDGDETKDEDGDETKDDTTPDETKDEDGDETKDEEGDETKDDTTPPPKKDEDGDETKDEEKKEE